MNRRIFQIAERAYITLLRFYPKQFRMDYGEPMVQLYRDQCMEAYRSRGWMGVALLWPRILRDVGSSCLKEHGSNLTGESILAALSPRRVFVCMLFFSMIYVFLFANRAQPIFSSFAKIDIQNGYLSVTNRREVLAQEILTDPKLDAVISKMGLTEKFATELHREHPMTLAEARGILKMNVELKRIKNTDLVEFHVYDSDRNRAPEIANWLASFTRTELMGKSTPVQCQVVDSAAPALYPVSPKKALNFASGILVSLLATFLVLGIIRIFRSKRLFEISSGS